MVQRQAIAILAIWLGLPMLVSCSRSKYRLAADKEVYCTISEKNGDPRWHTAQYSIEMDARSRYHEPYNQDCPPMPQDDPAAHRTMHCVNGEKGWHNWHHFGTRRELENPLWREALGEYVELTTEGAVKLNINSALKLAYVNSPNHQTQLETLYISALDVTRERFRLNSQFFGGYNVAYRHDGGLQPAGLTFDPALQRYVISTPTNGVESNRLTVGNPTVQDPAAEITRRFATAGELVAGFANSFAFEFAGPNAGLSASLLNFTFIQPLLRGAGRDVALEQLTFAERSLLANLRAYAQFRQGFYSQIAIGEQGVAGPAGPSRNTSLQIFSGQGGVNGYVGLLQQLQQIRNSQDNLSLQEITLEQLKFRSRAGEIDLVQVDQFEQSVESEKSRLLIRINSFEQALDSYKTNTLGMPPNLLVELDPTLIDKFQLIDRQATTLQDAIVFLQRRKGIEEPSAATDREIRDIAIDLMPDLRALLDDAAEDVLGLEAIIPQRKRRMSQEEISELDYELKQLGEWATELEEYFELLSNNVDKLEAGEEIETWELEGDLGLPANLADADEVAGSSSNTESNDAASNTESDTISPFDLDLDVDETVNLLRAMLRIAQSAILVQARARLEAITVQPIELDFELAYQLALGQRLDFMNGRTFLVDRWRLIQTSADALQSVLNLTVSGDMQTARNNPLSFRAPTSNLRMGLQFDAPFTRLEERNTYRQALIQYQRDRRNFIQSQDRLHLGLRVLLRQIEQLRLNLEIQRGAVAIAIRRVDLTRAALYAPVRPPQPGQRGAQFGPTAAFNLLSAQSALRDTQDALLSTWLSYYAARIRLARELGVMRLDLEGRLIDEPLPGEVGYGIDLSGEGNPRQMDYGVGNLFESNSTDDAADETGVEEMELPPPVPEELIGVVEKLPEGFEFKVPDLAAMSKLKIRESSAPHLSGDRDN